jgi:hypothetical protein
MYDHIQRGEYLIGDREMYFRSKWEANYALYLEFLKKQGEIKDWHYEVKMFDFPIPHGVTRYMPDFQVIEKDGSVTYREVKGYMDSRSKTKLKRMKKYYPQVKIELVDGEQMRALNKYKKLLKFY